MDSEPMFTYLQKRLYRTREGLLLKHTGEGWFVEKDGEPIIQPRWSRSGAYIAALITLDYPIPNWAEMERELKRVVSHEIWAEE